MENTCPSRHPILALTLVGFLVSLQQGFTTFLDSSYLGQTLKHLTSNPDRVVGYVFALAAALGLAFFLFTPKILRRFGNTELALFATITLPLSLVLVAKGASASIVIPAYLIAILDTTIIFTVLDIYLSRCVDPHKLGLIHGIYFAGCSLGFMLTPAAGGFIAEAYSMSHVYLAAAVAALPIPFIIWLSMSKFKDPEYEDVPVLPHRALRSAAPDLVPVFAAQFALQTFYAIMTIYVPLYFVEKIGFTYDAFGYAITIALACFVILPTPLGWLADKYLGEKEMIISGMCIMGLTLALIPFLAQTTHTFVFWTILLVISRIGATATESMSDAFYFKRIEHAHPSLIAFYRRARPLSLIVVPAIGATLLSFGAVNMSQLLIGSGVLVLLTIAVTAGMVDTR